MPPTINKARAGQARRAWRHGRLRSLSRLRNTGRGAIRALFHTVDWKTLAYASIDSFALIGARFSEQKKHRECLPICDRCALQSVNGSATCGDILQDTALCKRRGMLVIGYMALPLLDHEGIGDSLKAFGEAGHQRCPGQFMRPSMLKGSIDLRPGRFAAVRRAPTHQQIGRH